MLSIKASRFGKQLLGERQMGGALICVFLQLMYTFVAERRRVETVERNPTTTAAVVGTLSSNVQAQRRLKTHGVLVDPDIRWSSCLRPLLGVEIIEHKIVIRQGGQQYGYTRGLPLLSLLDAWTRCESGS